MFDHVLVDEYQDTNALQADILEGMRPPDTAAQHHGGRRRRAVDLRVPRRDRPQHPGVPDAVRRRDRDPLGAELPVDHRRSSPRRTRRSRSRRSATRRRSGPRARARDAGPPHVPGRGRAVRLRVPERAATSRGGRAAEATGRAVPRRAPLGPARGGAGAPQHPVREVRRAEVPGGRAREGRALAAAGAGEPVRRGELVPRAAAARRASDRPRPAG